MAVKSEVWYLVGMDLIGPFKRSPEGYQYVLTMTDYFSKYVEVVPILDKSAIAVAIAIYQVYCTHGAPVAIIADQGREFNNKVGCMPGTLCILMVIRGYAKQSLKCNVMSSSNV